MLYGNITIPQLTWVSSSLIDTVGKDKLEYGGKEKAVTYLPLSHIAGTVQTQSIIHQKDNIVSHCIIGS